MDATMAPGDSVVYSDLYDLWQHDPQVPIWPLVSWACVQPSVIAGAAGIKTDPGCDRAVDPDMVSGCSLVPVGTLAMGGSAF